jgi:hypothetical protein
VLSHVLLFFLFKLIHALGGAVTIEQLHRTLTGIHGFPMQAAVGLLVGFVLATYMQRRMMVWIWLLPLAFLCIGIIFVPKDYSSVWGHFFGTECNVSGHCYDQMLFTMPLVASAAYSLGATLRSQLLRTAKLNLDPTTNKAQH